MSFYDEINQIDKILVGDMSALKVLKEVKEVLATHPAIWSDLHKDDCAERETCEGCRVYRCLNDVRRAVKQLEDRCR